MIRKCHGCNDVNEASFLQVIDRLERLRKVAGGCIAQRTGIFVNNSVASSIIAKRKLEQLQQQSNLRQTDRSACRLSRLLIPKCDYLRDRRPPARAKACARNTKEGLDGRSLYELDTAAAPIDGQRFSGTAVRLRARKVDGIGGAHCSRFVARPQRGRTM